MTKTKQIILSMFSAFIVMLGVFGQENTYRKCSVDFDGQCVRKVRCKFEDNIDLDEGELVVSLKHHHLQEEIIAQCDWRIGHANCDPVKGYTCDLSEPKHFSIFINKTEKCVTSGEFRVDAAHQQTIRCNISEYNANISDPNTLAKGNDIFEEKTDDNVVVIAVCTVVGLFIVIAITVVIWMKKKQAASRTATQGSGDKDTQEKNSFLHKQQLDREGNGNCIYQKLVQNIL